MAERPEVPDEQPAYTIDWFWRASEETLEGPEFRADGGDRHPYQHVRTVVSPDIVRSDEPDIGDYVFYRTTDPVFGPADPERAETIVREAVEDLDLVVDAIDLDTFDQNRLTTFLREWIGDIDAPDLITTVREVVDRYVVGFARQARASRLFVTRRRQSTIRTGVRQIANHARGEEHHRQQSYYLDTDPRADEYSGPLYAYAIDDRTEQSMARYVERQSPINLVLGDEVTLNDTDQRLKDHDASDWGESKWLDVSYDRYVIVHDRATPRGARHRLRPQTAESDKRHGRRPSGYHARWFRVKDMDDNHDHAGQLHHDPTLHGRVTSNWKFAHSRREYARDLTDIHPQDLKYATLHIENVYRDDRSSRADFTSAGGAYTRIPAGGLTPDVQA